MHRAEKSSSKICRAREVEKAQELHRRKIDGVKSYLSGIIPKPTQSRTAAAFRHRPTRSMLGSFSSVSCVHGCPPLSAGASLSSSNLSRQQTEQEDEEHAKMDQPQSDEKTSGDQNQPMIDFQRSLAKMEEFRGVAPVPGLGSVPDNKSSSGKFPPPPAEARRKTLNGSFRARRLKEIKADNLEVFQRIRKSVSHYRNDDLRRDWHQNLSYLSSITEFPLTLDSGASTGAHKMNNVDDGGRNVFGPSPRRPSFLSTATRTEALPILPLPVHPIKSIPTSPKKLQLNMTPAFRSLRKAMPQQPSLPPISSPHSVLNAGSSVNANAETLSSPKDRKPYSFSPGHEERKESPSGRGMPARASTAVSTTFIGDLHGKQAENDVSGDAKYQLLKTGRFVGGTYLVLTVFCGDGVTNPYGFDVFAYHRELQCEYKLSITKEMTHELLDKSSSTVLAAETEAAAGTNLSMQEIARSICDHIHFAMLGADQGEMIFLVPTATGKHDPAMRFDASPPLVAFCVHQCVELEAVGCDDASRPQHSHSKQKLHVFASTCPPKRYPASTTTTADCEEMCGLMVSFQLMETLPPSRCISYKTTPQCVAALHTEVGVDDIYNSILRDSWQGHTRVLSVDRMVVAAIRHLHVITVPSGDDIAPLRKELILNARVNAQLQPCSSHVATTSSALGKKRSRLQLPRPASQVLEQATRNTVLLQTGLIWRNAYLLAEVAVDTAEHTASKEDWNGTQWQEQEQLVQDTECSLVVSVFNANSGHSSSRRLSPEKISTFAERLEALSAKAPSVSYFPCDSERHSFARKLLTQLQLDVNLFGQEVIVFPTLEHTPTLAETEVHSGGNSTASSPRRRASEKDVAGAETDGFLPRKVSWVSDNISEGDEGQETDEYDEEDGDVIVNFSTGVEHYAGFDDGEDETDASYDSRANQDEAPEPSLDSSPEQEESTTPADVYKLDTAVDLRRRRGQKLNGRFCLVLDDNVLAIASSGQLDDLDLS